MMWLVFFPPFSLLPSTLASYSTFLLSSFGVPNSDPGLVRTLEWPSFRTTGLWKIQAWSRGSLTQLLVTRWCLILVSKPPLMRVEYEKWIPPSPRASVSEPASAFPPHRKYFWFIYHHWLPHLANPASPPTLSALITVCVPMPAWSFKNTCLVCKPGHPFFFFLFLFYVALLRLWSRKNSSSMDSTLIWLSVSGL